MNNVSSLHDQAMELADRAFLARRAGETQLSSALTRQALDREIEAAASLKEMPSAEPTRSILFRSAASLAIDIGEYRIAENMVANALAGDPPPELQAELHELLSQAAFLSSLKQRNVDLEPGEIQLSIAGSAVGPGITLSVVFIDRVKDMERVILRTAERLLGHAFRERGAPKKEIRTAYSLYLTAPRAGSFEVSMRLGRQMELPGFDFSVQVVDEVIDCFSLITESQDEKLKERIPQEAYFHNFVGLARRIAPDGERVSVVALATKSKAKEVRLSISRKQKEIFPASRLVEPHEESKLVSVTGRLLMADARRTKGRIQLIDESGASHPVIVPEGMMNDIVRPLWDDVVTVTGIRRRGTVHLKDISQASE